MLKKGVLIVFVCLFLIGALGVVGCSEKPASSPYQGGTAQPQPTQPQPTQPQPSYKSDEVIEMSVAEFKNLTDAYLANNEREEEFANLIGKSIRMRGRFDLYFYGSYFCVGTLTSLEPVYIYNYPSYPYLTLTLYSTDFPSLFEIVSQPGLKTRYVIQNYSGSIITVEIEFRGVNYYGSGLDMRYKKITMSDGKVFESE